MIKHSVVLTHTWSGLTQLDKTENYPSVVVLFMSSRPESKSLRYVAVVENFIISYSPWQCFYFSTGTSLTISDPLNTRNRVLPPYPLLINQWPYQSRVLSQWMDDLDRECAEINTLLRTNQAITRIILRRMNAWRKKGNLCQMSNYQRSQLIAAPERISISRCTSPALPGHVI